MTCASGLVAKWNHVPRLCGWQVKFLRQIRRYAMCLVSGIPEASSYMNYGTWLAACLTLAAHVNIINFIKLTLSDSNKTSNKPLMPFQVLELWLHLKEILLLRHIVTEKSTETNKGDTPICPVVTTVCSQHIKHQWRRLDGCALG